MCCQRLRKRFLGSGGGPSTASLDSCVGPSHRLQVDAQAGGLIGEFRGDHSSTSRPAVTKARSRPALGDHFENAVASHPSRCSPSKGQAQFRRLELVRQLTLEIPAQRPAPTVVS